MFSAWLVHRCLPWTTDNDDYVASFMVHRFLEESYTQSDTIFNFIQTVNNS